MCDFAKFFWVSDDKYEKEGNNMGFHMKASITEVQELFRKHPHLLAKPRIPIAERARRVAAARTITTAEARAYTTTERFQLATNQFAVFDMPNTDFFHFPEFPNPFRGNPVLSEQFKALVLSHVGSNLSNAHLGVWFFLRNDLPTVKIYVANTSYTFKREQDSFILGDKLALFLEICFDQPTRLWLSNIETGCPENCLGGKTLAAVYNITKALSLPQIALSTFTDNRDAQRFYFHTDFGSTNFESSPNMYLWYVDVA